MMHIITESEQKSRVFKCPICGKTYKKLGWLQKHIASEHGVSEYGAKKITNSVYNHWYFFGFNEDTDETNVRMIESLLKTHYNKSFELFKPDEVVEEATEDPKEPEDIEGSNKMDANQLIELVEEEKKNNWENSDIGAIEEGTLETIADHFKICETCRSNFDSMNYPETTLPDFSSRILKSNSIFDWVC